MLQFWYHLKRQCSMVSEWSFWCTPFHLKFNIKVNQPFKKCQVYAETPQVEICSNTETVIVLRRIENPRIVLLDCSLEYKKGESQVSPLVLSMYLLLPATSYYT